MDRFIDLVFNLRDVQHTQKILQAIRYVKQHFQEKISLQDTAESVHLSPSYFSKLFKLEMSTTFSEYLNEIRIEEAKNIPTIQILDEATRPEKKDKPRRSRWVMAVFALTGLLSVYYTYFKDRATYIKNHPSSSNQSS